MRSDRHTSEDVDLGGNNLNEELLDTETVGALPTLPCFSPDPVYKAVMLSKKQVIVRELIATLLVTPLFNFGIQHFIMLLTLKYYERMMDFNTKLLDFNADSTNYLFLNTVKALTARFISHAFSGWSTVADKIKHTPSRYAIKTLSFVIAVVATSAVDRGLQDENNYSPENTETCSTFFTILAMQVMAKTLESLIAKLMLAINCCNARFFRHHNHVTKNPDEKCCFGNMSSKVR